MTKFDYVLEIIDFEVRVWRATIYKKGDACFYYWKNEDNLDILQNNLCTTLNAAIGRALGTQGFAYGVNDPDGIKFRDFYILSTEHNRIYKAIWKTDNEVNLLLDQIKQLCNHLKK